MRNVIIAAVTAMALITGSLAAAAPASAGPLNKFCWYHPYAPICYSNWHYHHHHHHYDWWW